MYWALFEHFFFNVKRLRALDLAVYKYTLLHYIAKASGGYNARSDWLRAWSEQDITQPYYMPNAVSGQDEPNLALWLATRAGKMELSFPLGIRALSRKYTDHALVFFLSHIINPLFLLGQ